MKTRTAFVHNCTSSAPLSGGSLRLMGRLHSCWTRDVRGLEAPNQPSLARTYVFRMCAQTEKRPDVDKAVKKSEKAEVSGYQSIEKYVTATAYVGFVVFVFFLAPGNINDSGQLGKILSGHIDDVSDLFFAIFNLVGAIGVTFAAVLNPGAARQKKFSTSLFSVVGAIIGFLALGPYLIGREYAPTVKREEVEERGLLSRVLESRFFGLTVMLYTLWIYGFTFGLFTPGSEQLHDAMFYAAGVDLGRLLVSDHGVSTTTVDTCLLAILFWGPLTEDMRRRGWFRKGQETESWLTTLSILSAPGLGPALYLVLRPRLPSGDVGSAPSNRSE